MPGIKNVGKEDGGVIIKGSHTGDLCGDGIVLHPDCAGG